MIMITNNNDNTSHDNDYNSNICNNNYCNIYIYMISYYIYIISILNIQTEYPIFFC